MKKIAVFFLLLASLPSICMAAVGDSASSPGFSAQDIYNQNPSAQNADGVYWIDPDLPAGSDAPFQVYADMTVDGGGWIMGNDTTATQPTLNGHTNAIAILAQDTINPSQVAEIRFVGTGYDAYYTGLWGKYAATEQRLDNYLRRSCSTVWTRLGYGLCG